VVGLSFLFVSFCCSPCRFVGLFNTYLTLARSGGWPVPPCRQRGAGACTARALEGLLPTRQVVS
jgi:hypothetical protein